MSGKKSKNRELKYKSQVARTAANREKRQAKHKENHPNDLKSK